MIDWCIAPLESFISVTLLLKRVNNKAHLCFGFVVFLLDKLLSIK